MELDQCRVFMSPAKWIEANFDRIGRESSADLSEVFL